MAIQRAIPGSSGTVKYAGYQGGNNPLKGMKNKRREKKARKIREEIAKKMRLIREAEEREDMWSDYTEDDD